MSAVRLIALKAFPYASGSIAAGEVFEARSSFDITALIAAGMASIQPPQARRLIERAEPVADIEPVDASKWTTEDAERVGQSLDRAEAAVGTFAAESRADIRKRRYQRKDVVAE